MKEENSRIVAFRLQEWGMTLSHYRRLMRKEPCFGVGQACSCGRALPTESELLEHPRRIHGFTPCVDDDKSPGLPYSGFAAISCWGATGSCGKISFVLVSHELMYDILVADKEVGERFWEIKYAA